MNIVFITNSIGYGGAEKIMNFITDYLSNNGHSVMIVNLNSVPAYVNEHRQNFNRNIKIFTLENKEKNKHIFRVKYIVSVVKKYRADVMIAFTRFPNFYAKIASWLTGIPSIMSERGDPNVGFSRTLKDLILYCVINLSSGGVFQTTGAAHFYMKLLRKRAVVIPNPIFLNKDDIPILATSRQKTVVSVGRFQNIQKRYDIMLKAFKEFVKTHPEYILKLYGSGEDENSICHWIEDLDLSDKVKIMGAVKNPISLIYKEGIFVITSDYEGIPNSLLEAMAVGLPVVSTDCTPGGARMLIKNNENGQIVPKGDYMAVAEALSRYADNIAFAEFCGNNAKKVLKTFAPSVIGNNWDLYIKSIVNKLR